MTRTIDMKRILKLETCTCINNIKCVFIRKINKK